jgi:signal transduction histidine kinase
MHGRLRDIVGRQPHADIAVAVIVYAVTLLTTAAGPAGGRLGPVALGAGALACGALTFRRRAPVAALVVSAVGAEAYLIVFEGRHGTMVLAAPLIALYSVAEASTGRRALTVGVLAVLVFAGLHMLVKPSSWLGAENLALAALGGLAVAAGEASRNRRAYLAEAQARARQAEADRDAEAGRRVTEERLRIARDLHDAIGHQLALIHVQAQVATHLMEREPARSREALAHVGEASRTALDELSDSVTLLRKPAEPLGGLDAVGALIDSFRRAGLTVTDGVDGTPCAVPAPVGLTAYRLLQETLTNVRKHAGPVAVTVRLTYAGRTLRIVVDNDGPAGTPTPAGAGHGLVGMRERVAALGGSLLAGPRPGGGYRVAAELPLGAA